MKITTRNWFICLIAALLITDLAIFLDIPVLRQVLGFLYFTIVPGLLILDILKLNRISLLKKFLLSVGLSIAFLLFAGLLVNTLLPFFGYLRPLSAPSLLLSFNIILLTLGFIAYWKNRKDFDFPHTFNFGVDNQNKLISPLLLSLLFPLLSVLGTRLMNTSGNNVILLAMFSLIPIYIVLLLWQNRRIPNVTYPIAVSMMSMALLLSRGLTSNYLMGGDIYTEYHASQVTLQSLHWSMANFPAMVGGSLSVSLLPTIFQSLFGIDPVYVFKLAFPILVSLSPVIVYAICEKYLAPVYAFLASCFFVVQLPFMYLLTGQLRVGIALFFFSLTMMVLLDANIGVIRKRVLFAILGVSTIVAYYVTPVLLMVLILVVWLVSKIPKSPSRSRRLVGGSSVLLMLTFILLWWGVAVQILAPGVPLDLPGETLASGERIAPSETVAPGETLVPLDLPGETPVPSKETAPAARGYMSFLRDVFADFGLSDLYNPELRGPEVQVMLQLSEISLPRQVSVVVNYISFLIIGIGVIAGWLLKNYWKKIDPNYLVLISVSLVFAALPIILPRLSITYAGDRLYLQLLVFLAPAFIIGCQSISKYILPKRNLLLVGVVLVSLFLSNSYLLHKFLGSPQGDVLSTESSGRAQVYVYDSEVQAAYWLGDRNVDNTPVYLGNMIQLGGGIFEFTSYGVDREFEVLSFSKEDLVSDGSVWVFLRRINVVDKQGYNLDEDNFSRPFSMAEYASLLSDRNRIYTTGDTEIYR